MTSPVGWILGIAIALALVGGAGIWHRARGPAVAVRRIVWWTLGVAGLALLAGSPLWTRPPREGVILLTPGADGETVRRLSRRAESGWRVFDLGGDRENEFPEAGDASDFVAWALSGGARDIPLVVAGWGLREWDWRRLESTPSGLEAPADPEGIFSVEWARQLDLGEALDVRAMVRFPTATTLRLVGPGGPEDSAEVAGGDQQQAVRLRARPRLPGRHLYRLREERAGGASRERPLEVTVRNPELPSLLWLEEEPSFESRTIRDWLAGTGAEVAVRSRISRERYRIDTFNLADPPPLGTLTPAVLERFDVVVLDARSRTRLSDTETEALETEVTDRGLGVLLRLAEAPAEAPWGFEVRSLEEDAASRDPEEGGRFVRPVWGPAGVDVPPLDDQGLRFGVVPGDRVLARDRRGRPLGVWRARGRGRVAATTLTESHLWALEGRGDLHHDLWTELLSRVARPVVADRWVVPAGPVLLHDPLEALVISSDPAPAIRLETSDGATIPLAPRQDASAPHEWRVRFHPRARGWHRLVSPAGALSFFAEDPRRWTDWDRARRLEATRLAALEPAARAEAPSAPPPYRLLLWVAAIGSLAVLWADERLR